MIFQFLSSFILSAVFAFLFINFSEKTSLALDKPDNGILKIHKKKISLLGGLAFAITFFIIFSFNFFAGDLIKTFSILSGAAIIFLVGFFDDIKWKGDEHWQKQKLIFLILCTFIPAVILYFSGIVFNFLPFWLIAVFLSFLYIFGAINSVNYQDGIDGLAGGLVFISFVGFIFLGLSVGDNFIIKTSFLLLGSILGFLVFNFPPAKIFMGDSGAYFLGFALAFTAMAFSRPYDIFSVLGPFLIIGIPAIDGIYTNFRKIKNKQSLLAGDRFFYYDKLASKYSVKKTLFIAFAIQVILVSIGIFIYQ